MTLLTWEYATVSWESRMRKVFRSDPDWQRLAEDTRRKANEQGWAHAYFVEADYYLWFPGASEGEKRHAWHTNMPEEEPRALLHDVLNELGQDRWELVSSTVRATAMGSYFGRDPAGFPIAAQYVFKRPVIDADG